ncbi:MAG TPA: hypothetical protein PK668_07485 [Myxococcota bacterium]|nr:hypothetical protein [Myxococcota bacterium]HRY92312.1 hypothetical protein [Myxococcota bacterium]HSA22732.1 hypothetical protein [Myxococcota bacterium]
MLLRHASLAIALLASAVALGGWSSCEPSLIEDPSFDLWCGQSLCAWQLEAGEVRRVSTWHPADAGVELVGDPAAISQLLGISSRDVSCLRFETLAQVDADASVTLEMDFLDDGSVDYRTPVAGNDWAAVSYLITPPSWYRDVRLGLRKTGPGRAVLAHLRVTESSECSDSPLPLPDRPLGANCLNDAECADGLCGVAIFPYASEDAAPGVCGACRDDAACAAGEVCGADPTPVGFAAACGPAGRHVLGERCLVDGECATGVCCLSVCAECCPEIAPCADGGACLAAALPEPLPAFSWLGMPAQCDPREGEGAAGAVCLVDEDCQSGSCQGSGPLRMCLFDSHPCETDADCPFGNDLSEPACRQAGVRDGRCG